MAAWAGQRPRSARWPWGRLPAARRAVVAASHANSSSNPPGRDKRDEAARKEEEKVAASPEVLKQQLAVAAQLEDYKGAARLRDSLRSFEEEAWVSGPCKVFDELPLQVQKRGAGRRELRENDSMRGLNQVRANQLPMYINKSEVACQSALCRDGARTLHYPVQASALQTVKLLIK